MTSRGPAAGGVVISPLWLALLAGPSSFGIAGPALVLAEVARGLETSVAASTAVVTAFGWGLAAGTPLMGVLLDRKGIGPTLTACGLLAISGASVVPSADGLPVVLVGMALQGLGAAGMIVAAMNLAGSPASLGVVTASLAIVGAASPLIGGLVSGLFGWRVALGPAAPQFGRPSRGGETECYPARRGTVGGLPSICSAPRSSLHG